MIKRNGPIAVKLDRKTARALEAQAKARGLSLKEYLQQLVAGGGNGKQAKGIISSASELDEALDEFFAKHPDQTPPLPNDFGRADIYNDHD